MGFDETLAIHSLVKFPSPDQDIQRIEWILSGIFLDTQELSFTTLLDPVIPTPTRQKKKVKKRKLQKIPSELQKLFATLQLSDQRAVSTKELTKSFGWSESDVRDQHDVHELNRVSDDNPLRPLENHHLNWVFRHYLMLWKRL